MLKSEKLGLTRHYQITQTVSHSRCHRYKLLHEPVSTDIKIYYRGHNSTDKGPVTEHLFSATWRPS